MANSGKQIKIGAILSYLAIFINIVSALIYTPWMLSRLGEGDYGLFTLAHSLINMFLLDFGISAAVTRFISKYKAEGEQEKINQLLGLIYKLFIIISIIIFVVLFVLYFFIEGIYGGLTAQETIKFKNVFIIFGIFTVVSFPLAGTVNGILTSYEKFIPLKVCDILHKIINVLLIVFAILLKQGLYVFVIITACGNLLTFVIKFIIIKASTPIKIRFKYFDKKLLKDIFSFSIWMLVNTICSRLIINLCPNILGMIPSAGTLAITIFSFASTIEGYTFIFANAIDGMFMPKIARILYKDHRPDKLLNLMIKVGKFQFAVIGLIFVGFTCVGGDFMTLWLGGRISVGSEIVYWCALLLLFPAPFYLSQQIGRNSLIVMGKVKEIAIVNIIKAVLSVVLVTIFSIFYGALGACLAICIVYLVRNVLLMILYKKILKLNVWQFIKNVYRKSITAFIITLIFGLLLIYFYSTVNWVSFFVKTIAVIFVFLISYFIFGLSKEEKAKIYNKTRKIFVANEGSQSKQNNSIDVMKFICAILIIILHTAPFSSYSGAITYLLRNCITTIAVPFFFIASGYLFSKKQSSLLTAQEKKVHFIKWLSRIFYMYLFWSAIYFIFVLIKWLMQDNFTYIVVLRYIKDFFLNGSYLTIWYLLATLVGGLVMGLLRKKMSYAKIIIVASIIYMFSLFASAYYYVGINLPILGWLIKVYYVIFNNVKNGIFFALLFMSIGGWFGERKEQIKIKPLQNVLYIAIFWVMMVVEQVIISKYNLGRSCDTVLFIVPLSFFIFNFILSFNFKESEIYIKLRKLSILLFLTQRIPITIIELWLSNTIIYTNSMLFFITVLVSSLLISIFFGKLSSKIKTLKKFY